MTQLFARSRQLRVLSTLRTRGTLATVVAAGLAVLAGNTSDAATPEAGKAPVRIADKDWKIEIVPGAAIGPSPVPAFNAAARRAASKLTAKSQEAIDAAKAVQPTEEPAEPPAAPPPKRSKIKPAAAKDISDNDGIEPASAQTADAQPLPVIAPDNSGPGVPGPIVVSNTEQPMPRSVSPADYAEVYNSIPFSRAEYFANPGYRHEATMEILFGQLRPKSVVQLSVPLTQTTHGIAIPFRSHSTIRQDIRYLPSSNATPFYYPFGNPTVIPTGR